MADISTYIAALNAAARGEEVREPIVNALNQLNNGVTSAQNLRVGNNIYPASSYVLRTEYEELTNYDSEPIQNSGHAVTSNGLYHILGLMDYLLETILGTDVSGNG